MDITRRVLMGAAAAGVAFTAAGCNRNGAAGGASGQLQSLLDRLATDLLRESPESATGLAVSEEQAGGRYIDRLEDPSREALTRYRGIMQSGLTDLRAIDRDALSQGEQVSLDVVTTSFENNIADTEFAAMAPSARYPFVVSQLNGSYQQTPDFLVSQHPLTNRDQADAYLTRLSGFARVMDEESRQVASDAQAGVMPPDYALDGALRLLGGFAQGAPAQNILVATYASRLAEVADIPEADRNALATRAETIVRDELFPAYARQIAALRAIRPRATHDAGIWRVPQGDEMYATALRAQTTTSMTPDEIHQMGVELVAQHSSEMDAILRAQGLTRGSVAERVQVLAHRPDQLYPNTAAGREQLLADLNGMVRAITARMPDYFGRQARAQLEIKRIPEYTEAGATGGYYQQAALDGSRPGAYYINLRDTTELPKFGLPTLTYHEGVPGHHWQISLQQEAEDMPFIRTALMFFGAYVEGWALYSEQLADEIGMYADNPINRIGYLQSSAFRASRLVVDTGIHSKRWTREQAIDSMAAATGDARSVIATEVERYSVWPGQACCYMVGKQAILRAREAARTAMGDRFDLKGFHDTVVDSGQTPLSVTETLVQRWAAAGA